MYADAADIVDEHDREVTAWDLLGMKVRRDPESDMYVYLDHPDESGRRLTFEGRMFPVGYDVTGDDPVRGSIIGWIIEGHLGMLEYATYSLHKPDAWPTVDQLR
ncbi:MAG: hypothetical protein SW127_07325 [Actinomycetota bacterium]|nr:hypothetical protein [Actinomycetota bacterium]